jgi:two-component system response regulator HydG
MYDMKVKKPSLLVVDDDNGHRLMLEALLSRWNFGVSSAVNGREAVDRIRETPFDAVLMDIRMPDMDGIAALKAIKAHNPAVPVVLMTAYSAVESAVEALKSGAYDYLIKPLDFDVLRLTLDRTLEHSRLKSENHALRQQAGENHSLIGSSPAMRRMLDMLETVAPSEATVLITGKSGTGKELVARAVHRLSPRRSGPWVAVNCAALTESLLESELFGHEKGAFTGADKRRDGRFLQADGGTLFLDEIGEISPLMQVKLLRALQQREIQRVGGDETLAVDARIVAATNRELPEAVKSGQFREDLYYRLNVVSITVPSLQERREDIPLLVQHFMNVHSLRNRKEVKGITPLAMDMLLRYGWPGNVRELENAMERAVILLCAGFISERELPPAIVDAYRTDHPESAAPGDAAVPPGFPAMPASGSLEDMERALILQTLRESGDNKSEAARRLGISRKTLHTKLRAISNGKQTGDASARQIRENRMNLER